jgi:sugar fermentation stimulation protein A
MKFEQSLNQGILQKRYKRFFTDIEFEGQTITAHCPNTGSMMNLKEKGLPCLFSTNNDPKRKLKHTLQMVKAPKSWVGVNTSLPNKLVTELFLENSLQHWKNFDRIQAEVKISDHSRIDLVLWNQKDHDVPKWNHKNLKKPLHLVEVKNVTLSEGDVALFPDAVTERGLKHLDELIHFKKLGYTCEMVFVIQRTDCQSFSAAKAIDPAYAKKLFEAQKAGVLVTPLVCKINAQEISLIASPIPFI